MSMDLMGGQPSSGPGGAGSAPGEGGGSCSTCGRPLPPPDLEAVAGGIDHTLSVETGKMVARTAWAGHAPDGVMDSLLSFMPSVRARRQLWERGQALWAERMTLALSGPCESCRGMAIPPPGPTMAQPYSDPAGPYQPTPARYQPAYEPANTPPGGPPPYPGPTSVMPSYGAPGVGPSLDDDRLTPTAVPSDSNEPDDEPATSAIPAFLSRTPEHAAPPPPAANLPPPAANLPPPDADEHESHTVLLSAPANLRSGPRLIVLEGPVHGRQFTLGRQLTTIGRSIGCHVTIEADVVGYDHARVVRADDGWRIECVGGAGDTFVNDDPVRDARVLQSGDVIRIGPARIRFEAVG